MGLPREDDDGSPQRNTTPENFGASATSTQMDLGPQQSRSRSSVTRAELYNESIFAKIANDDHFQHATLCIIVLNALWIGIDTEWNHKKMVNNKDEYPLDPTATVIENLFCLYFTVEVAIRFFGYRWIRYAFQDYWFVFDLFLVVCMVLETWVMVIIALTQDGDGGGSFLANFSALRLLRLLRLTRIARLTRSVPELMTLVKGMVSAAMSVGFILLFLILVMYVFAIIFVSIVGDAAEYPWPEPGDDDDPSCEFMFGTLEDAMMSLFTYGVLGDNLNPAVAEILKYPKSESKFTGTILFWLFFLFFAISSMTLLNMLIGVLCEVVNKTSTDEKEEFQVQNLKMCIEDAFTLIDTNMDGRVCEEEWSRIKDDSTVRDSLAGLGVDANQMDERLQQMQQTLFSHAKSATKERNKDGYTLDKLVEKVIEIRPDRPASALEIEILREKVSRKDTQFRKRLHNIEELLGKIIVKQGKPVDTASPLDLPMPLVSKQEASPTSLNEVPTQVLFHELKKRDKNYTEASTSSGPNGGTNLIFNQAGLGGAVSYSAIRNASNDLGN